MAAVEGHQARVASPNGPLRFACILILAYGFEASILQDQPSVSLGLTRLKTQGGDSGSIFRKCPSHSGEGRWAYERGICKDSEDVIEAFLDYVTCGKHGVRGSKPLLLNCDFSGGRGSGGFLNDRLVIWADNNRDVPSAGLGE
jgi:hypothetical protein